MRLMTGHHFKSFMKKVLKVQISKTQGVAKQNLGTLKIG